MRNQRHLYYVRVAKKTKTGPTKWSEWFGPVIAYGPYTCGLHFARQVLSDKNRYEVVVQVNDDGRVIEINYTINRVNATAIIVEQKQLDYNRKPGLKIHDTNE